MHKYTPAHTCIYTTRVLLFVGPKSLQRVLVCVCVLRYTYASRVVVQHVEEFTARRYYPKTAVRDTYIIRVRYTLWEILYINLDYEIVRKYDIITLISRALLTG